MNSRMLAELALKVWGVILLVVTLRAVPSTLLIALSSTDQTARLGLPLSIALSLLLAGVLMTWGGVVARRMISENTPIHLGIDSSQLQAVGFALVGLVTLVSGLTGIATIASVRSFGTWNKTAASFFVKELTTRSTSTARRAKRRQFLGIKRSDFLVVKICRDLEIPDPKTS